MRSAQRRRGSSSTELRVDGDGDSPDLADTLRAVHRGRSQGRQFYVSQVPNIGNPQFDREPAYAALTFPDAGYQLLGLYRFWNIIEYWFPYRDQLDQEWDRVLAEFGIGVFYPDKRPTQRIGIVPDVEVRPTIAGIRAGRDEVLEEGLRQILGRSRPIRSRRWPGLCAENGAR
jgi:hypothetical protein